MSTTSTRPPGTGALSPGPAVERPGPAGWRSFVVFVAVVVVVAVVTVVTGLLELFARDVWYENLRRPAWAASSPVIVVLGAVAYAAFALAGWRIWVRASPSVVVSLWIVLLGLSLAWTATFFGLWLPRTALAVGAMLLIVGFATAAASRSRTRPGTAFLLVFLAWEAYWSRSMPRWSP